MMSTPLITASTGKYRLSAWPLAKLLRALLQTRREVRRIGVLAERERLQLGYQRVPPRVWARHSALLIDL